MSIHKVFVFGAGASVESGVPLVKDVPLEILNDYPAYDSNACAFNHGTLPDNFIPKYQTALKIIDDLRGTNFMKLLETEPGRLKGEEDIKNLNFRFEEFLGRIDDCIENKRIYNGYSYQSLKKAWPFLHYIIFNTLSRGQKDRNLYSDFMSLLSSNNNCYLVSFNYDTLLDNALFDFYFKRSFALKQAMPWSYGAKFDYVDDGLPNYNNGNENISIYLLKPHGSFNWMSCNNCSQKALYYYLSYENCNYFNKKACPLCRSNDCELIIVPPTQFKRKVQMDIIKNINGKIKEALQKADEIVIIGYSFPPEDIDIVDLLRNNISVLKKPNLTVVNTSDADINKVEKNLKGKYNNFEKLKRKFSEYINSEKVN